MTTTLLKPLILYCLLFTLSGCSSLSYYQQLASGHWQLLQQRQPISQLLSDPEQPPTLRQRLQYAQQARQFASQALGLPDNGSYQSYVDLQREFVVWNLFATPAYSLEPVQHCFPIAGCVAYRGYYQPNRARGAAAILRNQGLDVAVSGVEAYSTLGWFDDPLLSSMLRRSDERLAALIFHELAHQQVYVADDTAFNESFASFVEQQGLRQWRTAQGLSREQQAHPNAQREFIDLILASRTRLQQLYQSGQSEALMESAKQAEFQRLRRDYHQLKTHAWNGHGYYDGWFSLPLNNARLLPFGLYDQHVPAFAALFRQVQGQWPAFYREVRALAAQPAAQRTLRLQQYAAEPAPSNP